MNLEINNKIHSQNCLYQTIPSVISIVNNITKLALPVLAVVALSYIPVANAGQVEYDFCISTCPSLIQYLSDMSQGWIPEISYENALAICHAACKFNLLF